MSHSHKCGGVWFPQRSALKCVSVHTQIQNMKPAHEERACHESSPPPGRRRPFFGWVGGKRALMDQAENLGLTTVHLVLPPFPVGEGGSKHQAGGR